MSKHDLLDTTIPISRTTYFISHPNVEISATVPVTQWPLSDTGKARMHRMLVAPWVATLSSIYCSTEQKSIDGAQILAEHLDLPYTPVQTLGENDRTSTGFLKPTEFEATADLFFSSPNTSIRGWETAFDAQQRIVDSVTKISQNDQTDGAIAIVSHGAVGTLLYCALAQKAIDRQYDQPGSGGGNYLVVNPEGNSACTWWTPIN